MISKESDNRSMWIAPCRIPDKRYWTVEDWKALDLENDGDWKTAVEIFEDRIQYRYLDAIKELQRSDDEFYKQHHQRRFGFSMMALDCLIIETLAQFYEGFKDSEEAKHQPISLNNSQFYTRFLTQKSFILKDYFNQTAATIFYQQIRCGILHQAETRENSTIWYRDQDHPGKPFELLEDGKSLRIFWFNFHNLVKDEFDAYCTCLRTKQIPDYRANFIKKMDAICRVRS